jgi:methyltransferase family protein
MPSTIEENGHMSIAKTLDPEGLGYITALDGMENSPSYRAFQDSPYQCHKHTTFFDVYDRLFSSYRGKKITFVEIGILSGGSLFMWRNFFGPEARIIGVDLNPNATKWREHGFEIHIGDQADEAFWREFISSVGDVDIILDDGGHTYAQQIITCEAMLPHIKDGGMLVVEDTHTSYMPRFGAKKYSFVEYAKSMADRINNRFEFFAGRPSEWRVWSMRFFESVVAFEINKSATAVTSYNIHNTGMDDNAVDYRHSGNRVVSFVEGHRRRLAFLRVIPGARAIPGLMQRFVLTLKDLTPDSRIRRFFSR